MEEITIDKLCATCLETFDTLHYLFNSSENEPPQATEIGKCFANYFVLEVLSIEFDIVL